MKPKAFLAVALSLLTWPAIGRSADRVTVLDTASPYRTFSVRSSDVVRMPDDSLQRVYELTPADRTSVDGKYVVAIKAEASPSRTAQPDEAWTDARFDDADWLAARGPFYAQIKGPYGYEGIYVPAERICVRGRFNVTDPSRVRGLTLSLAFTGGAVVYFNGTELTRSHLPAGKLSTDALADDYADDCFLAPTGQPLRPNGDDVKKYADRYEKRIRRIESLAIPAGALRAGVNVLAIDIRRAPAPQAMFTGMDGPNPAAACWWQRASVNDVLLTADAGSAVTPNTDRPKGPQVWQPNLLSRVSVTDWGDPNEPVGPIQIVAPINGAASGRVVASNTEAITALNVTVSDLAGPGAIPASAVQVRYALPDGTRRFDRNPAYFDSLDDAAPLPVAPDATSKAAVQPIWFTVRVPADAKPGLYNGQATVAVNQAAPVVVPIRLDVIGWKLADAKDFVTHVGVMQSPESVAMQYKVDLYSDAHFKLMDRTFSLLGEVGVKTIIVTAIRHTHFGNPHAMIRWVRGADGQLTPDFSIAEKYIDLAVKHLGKAPLVGLYCWEPLHTGHFEHKTFHGDRDIMITIVDPRTGELSDGVGPEWGTDACRAFWKQAVDGMKKILARHGMEKSLMVGISADYAPSKTAADDLGAAAPDCKWIANSHVFWSDIQGHPVGYLTVLWGIWDLSDPTKDVYGFRRFYGWRDAPLIVARFPRNELRLPAAGPAEYRSYPEHWICAQGKWMSVDKKKFWSGTCGFGRIGADFWPVLTDKRGRSRALLERYPDESSWGQLTLDYSNPAILGPGRDGPVATGRLEMIREGVQEAEARIFLEKALLDDAKRAKIDKGDADRIQSMLDERVRDLMRANDGAKGSDWQWYISSGWQRRSREIFEAAAMVADKLGG
ncbi:MAG: hypothetical protein BIFFINMI_01071 [Phycisphaerae bacterium]|nr:hypothetical protein [Phycisphaerae bacterium]